MCSYSSVVLCTVPSLATIVALYLAIGSVYNATQGKSGCPEVLPQYVFWKAFFVSAIVSITLLLVCTCTEHHCYYRRESTTLLILSLVVCVKDKLDLHHLQNMKNFSFDFLA